MTTYNRTITVAASVPTITQDFGTSDSVVVTVDATSYSFGATASVGVVSGNVAVSSSTVAIGSSFTITASAGGAYEVSVFLFDKVGGSQSGSVQGTVTAGGIFPASPTAANQSISTSTTSVNIPVSGGVATAEAYSLCVTPGLTTNTQVVNDRISAMTPYYGVGDVFTVSGSNLPSHGQSKNYYIYSYRYTAYGGAGQYYYASSFSIFRPFIPPSTSATCANTTIAATYTGSLTQFLLNADFADEAYRLCRTGGTKTFSQIAADQIGSTIARGTLYFFTIIDSELPGVGGTEDYTVYAYRYPDAGGQGVYVEAGTFYVTRSAAAPDTTPNAFDLGGPVTGVGASVSVFSNTITVSGINAATSISVSGTGSPAYSKNGGAFTSSSGTVVNGDTVQVRVTSSTPSTTSVTATLNIGGVTDTFTATTAVGGGAGSGISSGSSDYGIEIRGPNGGTKVLSPTTRYGCAMGQWDTFTLTAYGTALVSADMTDLTTSNSTLLILTNVVTIVFTITRESNGFRVENTTDASFTLKAVPIRF